jgi:tricorn protease
MTQSIKYILIFIFLVMPAFVAAQERTDTDTNETRLLRQPTVSAGHIAFAYGGDLWIADRNGGDARRLTSTPAIESDPHLSPDGQWLAFSSNRSGVWDVYVMPVEGGNPQRLTWYPANSFARGWTPDGSRVMYASSRETAPGSYFTYDRLWTVSREGGPSELLPAPFGHRGWFSPDGNRLIVDRVSRVDVEWRGYRGGQNTPLVVLDLNSLDETRLPNERTTDIHPVWMEDRIFFLSDRDWVSNVWSYDISTGELTQVTHFTDVDVKTLAGGDGTLVFEHDGWIHTLDPGTGESRRVEITVRGDFPWAMPRWVDVEGSISNASLSATGQRVLVEARGEIFTVPAEHGNVRNLTRSPGAADRSPVWSPDGWKVAWFSDDGSGYRLMIAEQDGLGEPRPIPIGESKMAWAPSWSPDGERIAFVDDRMRLQVIHLESEEITTVDVDGGLDGRTAMTPSWSPDSHWLAYAKAFPNHFRRIVVWSVESGEARAVTDAMAHAVWPAWDRDGRHLWFLASTDLGLSSGWANTSSINAQPTYGAYVMVLRAGDPSPFILRSDEEPLATTAVDDRDGPNPSISNPEATPEVRIDFEGIEHRIVTLPMPVRNYTGAVAGPKGSVFIGEQVPHQPGLTLHKFSLEDREANVFTQGATQISVSGDGSKILFQSGDEWRVVDTARPPDGSGGRISMELQAWIDPAVEWRQIFEESWRYQRDFFYDPNTHGADWDAVWDRYEPLVGHVRHRADLNYIIDKVTGELSVGHSMVSDGDMPETESSRMGVLGADLAADQGRWRITRIYTHEAWNPELSAPLDRPGIRAEEGFFLLAVNGREITAADDPYRFLDGTRGRQTTIHLNDAPTMDGVWVETVVPIENENSLRQRAWVEDNRRRVDELSGGRLAYVWVPNTGRPGVVSFDRYFFSQQDRYGVVIDTRFNEGGLLDDYMVDLMSRQLRAAITNEAEDGQPMRLPAGILGPKVLLINERSISGGDYLAWVFRSLGIGSLIGTRTWGGLVAACVPYTMVDGGWVTSPCAAVFEPGVDWIAENVGISPDIEVWMDARTVAEGQDPQLERGVEEALRLLEAEGVPSITLPPYSTPARRPAMVIDN